MKIELEEPFKSKWKDGYLVINPENRRNICLVNNKLNRTTISYARYLMCVKLGYILSDDYEVDHKDDDKTNDDINNLQVLTQEQNKLKQHYNYIMTQQNVYGVHCAYCGMPFLLTERKVNMKLAQNVENIFCNRSCANSFNYNFINETKVDVQQIKSLRSQGLSSYKISEITGYARNTVMKHW